MELEVCLNGTDKNPYHAMGLTQNPFPQVAQYEHQAAVMRLQKLGGDPIPDEKYIRDTLKGFSDEFVNLCCNRFKKGVYVRFKVTFPTKEDSHV